MSLLSAYEGLKRLPVWEYKGLIDKSLLSAYEGLKLQKTDK